MHLFSAYNKQSATFQSGHSSQHSDIIKEQQHVMSTATHSFRALQQSQHLPAHCHNLEEASSVTLRLHQLLWLIARCQKLADMGICATHLAMLLMFRCCNH